MVEWTKQDFRDAARLLAVLEQRSEQKRLAGGLEGPAEILDQPRSLADKGADGEKSALGLLDPRRQQSTVAGGACDGLVAGGASGLLRARCDVAMRPPAQPCAGPNSDGFTIAAEGIAGNARTAKGD